MWDNNKENRGTGDQWIPFTKQKGPVKGKRPHGMVLSSFLGIDSYFVGYANDVKQCTFWLVQFYDNFRCSVGGMC